MAGKPKYLGGLVWWVGGLALGGLAVNSMASGSRKVLAQPATRVKKRKNAIDWDTYFMATAFLARHRSKDPHYQVGACIVNDDKKIVGTGYNGFPIGCSDDVFPWDKKTASSLDCKHSYVCHAEMNAITFSNTSDVKGCTLYVSLFPCNECAKIIIQSGIKKVIYFTDEKKHKPEFKASKRMFDAAGVKYEKFVPIMSRLAINFSPEPICDAH